MFNLTASQLEAIARRATREAVRSDLRAGISVTGMVNGVIRTIQPTDVWATKMLQDEIADRIGIDAEPGK